MNLEQIAQQVSELSSALDMRTLQLIAATLVGLAGIVTSQIVLIHLKKKDHAKAIADLKKQKLEEYLESSVKVKIYAFHEMSERYNQVNSALKNGAATFQDLSLRGHLDHAAYYLGLCEALAHMHFPELLSVTKNFHKSYQALLELHDHYMNEVEDCYGSGELSENPSYKQLKRIDKSVQFQNFFYSYNACQAKCVAVSKTL